MLAGAARTYLQRYGVLPGRRAVVVTAHDEAYRAAWALHEAGITVAAVVDVRGAAVSVGAAGMTDDPGTIGDAGGLRIIRGATIAATGGRKRVAWIKLGDGTTIPCDLVLMCGGFTPSVHLFSQARGSLRFDPGCQAFVPGAPLPQVRSVGACAGVFGLAAALADGAGLAAVPADGARTHRFTVTAPPPGTGGMLGRDARRATARRSSISRTTSPPRTLRSRCARDSARSSTSSATPPPAWRPTRARPPMSTRSASPPTRWRWRPSRSG